LSFAVGIYGYTFTQPFDIADLRLEPLFNRHAIAYERGRDTKTFHLTGILIVPADSEFALQEWRQTFSDLEAALTFCEQQRVALSNYEQIPPNEDVRSILLADEPHDLKHAFPMQITVDNSLSRQRPRPTSGACLQFDAFAPDMRIRFLELALKKLADKTFQELTGFRSAFFRNTEMVKMEKHQ
jgi:hypothetical protein